MAINILTATSLKSNLNKALDESKTTDKDKRVNDGGGLYLLVKPSGSAWWRIDYSIDGKRKTLSLGVYPAIGLADARRKAETAREKIANGIDPSETRKTPNKQN